MEIPAVFKAACILVVKNGCPRAFFLVLSGIFSLRLGCPCFRLWVSRHHVKATHCGFFSLHDFNRVIIKQNDVI